jgi:hypothetical protein
MSGLTGLVALKTRCRRRGLWYRVLNRLERAQIDLTLRVVQRVRSPGLARVLAAIAAKLEAALESRVARLTESVGVRLARRLSITAQRWGNTSAASWAHDTGFARFLAVTSMNSPGGFSR